MKASLRVLSLFLFSLAYFPGVRATAQDWVRTGTNLGNQHIRLAAADFKPVGNDPQTPVLKNVFDTTLFNDLTNAGIFDMVSKSLAPQAMPGSPQELVPAQWSAQPANASMVAFGALSADNGRLVVYGWLMDPTTAGSPPVLARQYNETASQDMARTVAHRFADEIISRLGGGINGIAETKIYFVSNRTGSKEIWVMDYDGANQHAITHLGTVSMSPRVSPDGSRVAFASLDKEGWVIRMFSLDLGRMVSFPAGTVGSYNQSPAWSADGSKLAFSSARSGHPEIWVADAGGGNVHQITSFGADASPAWNPRTGAQLAFLSGRTGEPQIYVMDLDGSNVQRMTDSGYAISPSWSSNGGHAGLQLEPQVRSRRSRRARHLRDGHCQQEMAAGHARGGEQRFSIMVAGWAAHRLPAPNQPPHANLVDAVGRNRAASAHLQRRQRDAELELEMRLAGCMGLATYSFRSPRRQRGKDVLTRHPAFRMGHGLQPVSGAMHYDFIGARIG